jgi:alpha-L-rhamnosidase
MNSFNHYAYGAVGEWLFARAAGIDYDEAEPAFRTVRLRPLFHKALGWCDADHRGHLGKIASAWRYQDGRIAWTVEIPANCSGAVELPATAEAVTLDGKPLGQASDVTGIAVADGVLRFRIGSGRYQFTIAA